MREDPDMSWGLYAPKHEDVKVQFSYQHAVCVVRGFDSTLEKACVLGRAG